MIKFGSSQGNIGESSNYDIRGISEGTSGDIVIATFGHGLLSLEPQERKFKPLSDLSEKKISELTGLHSINEDYYLATSKFGITFIDRSSHNDFLWLERKLSQHRISDVVDVLDIDNKTSFIATEKSIIAIDFIEKSVRKIDLEIGSAKITSLAIAPNDLLLIGSSNGSIHFAEMNDGKITDSIDFSGKGVFRITDIETNFETAWIGSDNGLISMSLTDYRVTHFQQQSSKLSHNYITTLAFKDQILFIGTYQGLDQVNPNSVSNFNYRNSGVDNDILAFTRDYFGNLWIGTYNGLFRLDESTGKHHAIKLVGGTSLSNNRVTALASDNAGILVGLQEGGFYELRPEKTGFRALKVSDHKELSVTRILVTDGEEAWVTTYKDGVYKYENKNLTLFSSGSEKSFIFSFESVSGEIYLGSEKKLYRLEEGSKKFSPVELRFPQGVDSPLLLSIAESASGDIFIGTKSHGIFVWTKESQNLSITEVRQFGDSLHLAESSIYGIMFDTDDNLWCSTQSGILALEQDGEHKYRLTVQDGLQADDFNFGSFYLDSNQDMYFGGVNGYNRIAPRRLEVPHRNTKTILSRIDIDENRSIFYDEISGLQEIQLADKNHSLSLIVILVDFTNPAQNRYTHILEGQDPAWVDDGTNNTITYTNLEPGDYVFRAKGASSAGIWSTDNVSLRIQVLPPWWRTWWAYGLYIVSILIVIWIAMRLYRAHLLKEEAVRNAIEMQDAADNAHDQLQDSHEFQDDLVRAVHQHNLATLDLISSYLKPTGRTEVTTSKVLGHIKAMELLENCYYFQNSMLMADIHKYVDSLIPHLLRTTSVDPATITTINLTTSELLPAQAASPAAVILYELLENAFLHAFPEGSVANFIEVGGELIHSNDSRSTLVLSVSDDGTKGSGFGAQGANGGTGLDVVSSLARSMGGDVAISQEQGSKVQASLPLAD
ncbi:MAG: triple tyrosine motif-containing protein [Halioglobus sp.]